MQKHCCVYVHVVPTVSVYEKNGLSLKIQCDKQTETEVTVTLIASNSTQNDITNFTLQAAVPKVCTCSTFKLSPVLAYKRSRYSFQQPSGHRSQHSHCSQILFLQWTLFCFMLHFELRKTHWIQTTVFK